MSASSRSGRGLSFQPVEALDRTDMPKSRQRKKRPASQSAGRGGWTGRVVAAVLAAGLGVGIYLWRHVDGGDGIRVDVTVPDLSGRAARGEAAFARACAGCHGSDAAGSDRGPPLVHGIYEPGHHADVAFYNAIANGVRAHHWPFGDMPPQRHVDRATVREIVSYVRALQCANGIH